MYPAELKSLRELDLTHTRILRLRATMLEDKMPHSTIRTRCLKTQD